MAGNDPQKQLLTLIRDFASEKSQGERRIVNQKKRIEELQSELEAANAELEGEKRHKESTEQELKGYEVELSMNEASIQTIKVQFSQLFCETIYATMSSRFQPHKLTTTRLSTTVAIEFLHQHHLLINPHQPYTNNNPNDSKIKPSTVQKQPLTHDFLPNSINPIVAHVNHTPQLDQAQQGAPIHDIITTNNTEIRNLQQKFDTTNSRPTTNFPATLVMTHGFVGRAMMRR
ncbi:Hypothetical predicted protein [Olea europaea subsp. europaea]|uniref:Uncharacterized protein n=1 Tax=Olea europaea subsp. europaea TaxID=158383 RepID=A0A8S0RRP6_OLEEU|nr:Hypothetical predicted protein [Olea europaea subsp. europaea]